jgi:Fe-S-cluster containining protein
MAHANTAVYQDDDGWYLLVYNRCQHLLPTGGCGIYETRPQVCRDYDNDWCEYDEPAEKHFKKFFDSYQALDDFCRKKFKKWDKRFDKKK